PGRIEVIGNHLDHQGGPVIAASVNLDAVASVSRNTENKIRIYYSVKNEFSTNNKANYEDDYLEIDLNDPRAVEIQEVSAIMSEDEKKRIQSLNLVRGLLKAFQEENLYEEKAAFAVGGFDLCINSEVPLGSGLSSSAAIAMLYSKILNDLYNGGVLDLLSMAKCCQRAEHIAWGKKVGLLDPPACGKGGSTYFDFYDRLHPEIVTLPGLYETLLADNYRFVIVDTRHNPNRPDECLDHSDLKEEYNEIRCSMTKVAIALKLIPFEKLMKKAFDNLETDDFVKDLHEKILKLIEAGDLQGLEAMLLVGLSELKRYSDGGPQLYLTALERCLNEIKRIGNPEDLRLADLGLTEEMFNSYIGILSSRENIQDLDVLRAMHFFSEKARVQELAERAFHGKLTSDFILAAIRASGDSSEDRLQNVSLPSSKQKPVAIALQITKLMFGDTSSSGAQRIHGGGFAGVILVLLKERRIEALTEVLTGKEGETGRFPKGAVMPVNIRRLGTVNVNAEVESLINSDTQSGSKK
ncbi:MAG: hypothetical protein GYA55_10910, partial [SAR324 cluster bacterium]|nr:hypothetical protein [SAR324 cluster bacterium]